MQMVQTKPEIVFYATQQHFNSKKKKEEKFETAFSSIFKRVDIPNYPIYPVHNYFFAPQSIEKTVEVIELPDNSIELHPAILMEILAKFYIFDNRNKIISFLHENQYLMPILLEGIIQVKRVFGDFPLHLELHTDPEEGWDELFIIVKTTYSPEEAVALEEQLADKWFLDRMDAANGKLNFTEEPL